MPSMTMYSALFTLLVTLVVPTIADDSFERFFTEDFFPLIFTRLDPILSPGKISSHVHHVVGSSAFTAGENFASVQTGQCTTATIQADKSNYWAPQLYYKWPEGSDKAGQYTAINGDGMSAYWKYPSANPTDDPPFRVVPDDFRIVAGNISRNHYDPTKTSDQAVSFVCVDTEYNYEEYWYIPAEKECVTIRPQITFPECWDGVNSYKEDGSHVAYPVDGSGIEGGVCPTGYYKIPHLFLESTYHPSESTIGEGYKWYPGCFVLANGDNHGLSYHSDWQNGWPSGMLVDAYRNCYDTLDGGADHCDLLKASITTNGTDRNCISVGDVVNELAGQNSPIEKLPGNNPEYNSSMYSTNYPKAPVANYVEQSQVVQVTSDTQGYCITGQCYDYAGNGVASSSNTTTTTSSTSSVSASSTLTDSALSSLSTSTVISDSSTSSSLPIDINSVFSSSGSSTVSSDSVSTTVTATSTTATNSAAARRSRSRIAS